jgi:CRP-like cAMP-binding protein
MDEEHGLRDIYESTYGIIFFGTPHRGSSYAKMGGLAREIAVVAGFDARDTILRSLQPDAEILTILSDDFARMLLERSFKVHSFQEGMGFTGSYFLSRKVSSAQLAKFNIVSILTPGIDCR